GGAQAPIARRPAARAGARRAHRSDPANARRAGHVRLERLAADRLLRPSTGDRRTLHLDRQPVSVFGRATAAGTAGDGRVLVRAGAAVDVSEGLVGTAVPDRSRALAGSRGWGLGASCNG